jgi:hypothetical protein
MKPYRGEIHNWRKLELPEDDFFPHEGLGFKIKGEPVGHPWFVGWIVTSEVVKISEDNRIETLNSEYQLVGEEVTS